MEMLTVAFLYVVIMNIIGVMMMGIDKSRAKRHAWRIPEKTLFLISLLGGSVGSLAGMYLFRHKTKHMKFVIGMPLILLIQIVVLTYLYFKWRVAPYG
ncbi:MAG: DUF1294 domain-containing protein [Roseburia porci]|nr:DUF1294 domain-containing protein [Roseburia porci]